MRLWIVIALVSLLVGLANGCSQRTDRPNPTAESADSVEAALVTWYDALAAHDSVGIVEGLSPDFLLVEDTTLMTREVLVRNLLSGRGQGHQTTHMSDFHTVVSQSTAWTTLRNHEVWIPGGGGDSTGYDFIETVVLRMHDGRWRIERYHATPLKR